MSALVSPGTTAQDSSWWLVILGAVGVLVVYLVAVQTTTGQRVDNALTAWVRADEGHVPLLSNLRRVIGPAVMVPLAALVVLAGLLLRGRRTALAAGSGVAVCLVLPQLLKATLPRPQLADPWPQANSLPSGHTAAVAAVVVALLVVLPRSLRPAALVLGSLATVLMGVLVVALPHHQVSDVIASAAVGLMGWGVALLCAPGRLVTYHPVE